MLNLKCFLILVVFYFITPFAEASFHFTEVYSDQEVWRVDHFKASAGKLQELVESRSFQTQFEAMAYSAKVKSATKSIMFRFTGNEADTTPLWTVTNEWNEEWEEKYGEWVRKTFTKTFFVENNLATDCADVAYALRWIFSRNNGLPAAATLAGSGVNVTHLSAKAEWNSLPTHTEWQKDQRFLTALNWLLENVYTKTLYKDAYPVEITNSTIRPGLIHLMGGHVEVFNQVSYDAAELPMGVLSSTMPKAVRELAARPFLDSWKQKIEDGGLMRFRWPLKSMGWSMVPKTKMPFYSLEQFDEKLCEDEGRFAFCIIKKLGMSFNPELIVTKLQEGITDIIAQRTQIVIYGFNFCQINDCSPGTQAWEAWSTPGRDGRLLSTLKAAITTAYEISQGETFLSWFSKTKITGTGGKLSYQQLMKRMDSNFVSSDPRDDIDARWATDHKAIGRYIEKQFVQSETIRESMVVKARPCRENPTSCQTSRKLFQQYSTLEHDYKIRKTIADWWKFSQDEKVQVNKELEQRYKRLWLQSPAPWESLEVRNGTYKSKGHLLNASSLEFAGERFVILNQRRLYDVSARSEMPLELPTNGRLGFDKFTRQIYLLEDDKIKLYDEDFNSTGEFSIQMHMSGGEQVYNLGAGKLLLNRPYMFSSARILDLSLRETSEEISFTAITKESSGKKIFLLKGQPSRILSLKNNKVEIQIIADFDSTHINNFLEIGKDKYLIHAEIYRESHSSKIYSVKGNEVSEYLGFEGSHIQIERLNSNFFMLQSWNSNGSDQQVVLDSDFKDHFEHKNINRGKSAKDDRHIFFYESSKGIWKGILLSGKEISETKLTLRGDYVHLLTHSQNWLSYGDPITQTFAILDFDGRVLDRHTHRSISSCSNSDFYSPVCSGELNLLAENYDSPGENLTGFTMTRVGAGLEWQMKETLAYVIRKEGNSTSIPISIGDSTSFEVDTGVGIQLEDDVMLWFSKYSDIEMF